MDDLKARAASADQKRRARLSERRRQTFVNGAETDSRRRLGRGLTAEELERVLRRCPSDVTTPHEDSMSNVAAASRRPEC